jgi:hypothetical protein
VILVLASTEALEVMRAWPAPRRRSLRVRVHPDGGLWVAARGSLAQDDLLAMADKFGVRRWGPGGWRVLKPQLRLPGLLVGRVPDGGRIATGKVVRAKAAAKQPSAGFLGQAQPELPGLALLGRAL